MTSIVNKQGSVKSSSPSQNDAPDRPRLVLRIGFAGNRELANSECIQLKITLNGILRILGNELTNIAPYGSDSSNDTSFSEFFSSAPPLLRLITGLSEGADAIAGKTLEEINKTSDSGKDFRCFSSELAAVLPFDVATYRQSRDESFRNEFDRQLAVCSWIQVLDGIYDKPDDSELNKLSSEQEKKNRRDLANLRRARAYRAQSAFLLRHSDILIAAANPDANKEKAGGTMETIRSALAFGLPVIFINTGKENNNVQLIDPGNPNENLNSVLAEPAPSYEEYKGRLIAWVNQLAIGFDKSTKFDNKYDADLLREYFCVERKTNKWNIWFREKVGYSKLLKWSFQFRKKCWGIFRSFFRSGPSPKQEKTYESFHAYRERARQLNYHYSDLYRGAFLSNYLMVIAAVFLATVSLTLLTGIIPNNQPSLALLIILFILGTLKFIIVICILLNTKQANFGKWNEKAIDYRYLAERLRSMYYLPLAGSHRPPKTISPTSRKIRQSAADWLFNSLVRGISPADLKDTKPVEIQSNSGNGTVTIKKLLTISAEDAVTQVRDCWIGEQIKYHESNAATMGGMNAFIEKTASNLNTIVIAIVCLDLILIGGEQLHLYSEFWENFVKAATPKLIAISVILPAIIAALGGIRFQAECQRLAERSEVMRTILEKRDRVLADQTLNRIVCDKKSAQSQPPAYSRPTDSADSYIGGWALDSLHLTEHVANSFSQEISEWSVLYAKEVSHPG